MAYMDYMDLAVHCSRKAIKLNHSLTWIFKVKFWKCCISGMGGLIDRTKGMWVDRMLDSHCDLNFDLTHDLDLGSSRSVFEKAVSQEWEGQSTNTRKSIWFVNRNLIANQPINQYQKFELLISAKLLHLPTCGSINGLSILWSMGRGVLLFSYCLVVYI